jgi:glyoxalase family protein
MAQQLINGLHHVTAIASNPQRNVDFYAGVLGLRLIKKTVNFDAPDVYHLYYGDETGSPGTIMTFFPFGEIQRGRRGTGQLTFTTFAIPTGSMDFWLKRLAKLDISFTGPFTRFDEEVLQFEDFDGLGVELVETPDSLRILGFTAWTSGTIPAEYAIRGFHTVSLHEIAGDRTIRLLTDQMQHKLIAQEGDRMRFEAGAGGSGNFVDVIAAPAEKRGLNGAGTVHHVAFSSETDATQLEIRETLMDAGFDVTPVLDRNYFHSIYYREPGGILFEIATNPPGFGVDEDVKSLGSALKLPSWYEPKRDLIEQRLHPIEVKTI